MKPLITSISELYERQEPWGEPIVDAVVEGLRRSRIIRANDMAIMLDVSQNDLNGAVLILTGMTLGDLISQWRLLQAKELLAAAGYDFSRDAFMRQLPNETMQRIAHRCGWSDAMVMEHVLKRNHII